MVDSLADSAVEVVLGTYEQFIIGYKLIRSQGDKWRFEQSFTDHAHSGSIRSVAASSELIASGGTDEMVRIFSAKKRVDVGTLVEQDGTITSIEFFKNEHMFTASEDGTICVWDTRNWECLKTLRGHKASVLNFAVHPSGKMLLSVSKDKTLRTWNLIKGRLAYITNLKTVAHLVIWSPQGTDFLIAVDDHVDVYNVAQGTVSQTYNCPDLKRISSMVFISNEILLVSGDSKNIFMFDVTGSNEPISQFKAHENRVKSMFSTFTEQSHQNVDTVLLFTVSSYSLIKAWRFSSSKITPTLITSIDSTCRPTAFAVVLPKGWESVLEVDCEGLQKSSKAEKSSKKRKMEGEKQIKLKKKSAKE